MPRACLILACALWGLSFPLVKALHFEQSARIPDAGSGFLALWMQSARFGLGAIILFPLIRRRGRIRGGELRQGILLGLWGGGGMALQADGLAHTEASTSAFLTQAYCVLLPLIACVRTRLAPDSRTIAATVLVVAGCAALSGIRPGDFTVGRGEIETLLASLLFTVQILTLENPRYRENRGLPVTLVMCAAIAAMFLIPSLLAAPRVADVIGAGSSWPAFGLTAALALFCSVGAFLLMNHWQPKVSATEAGLIYTSEPLFTAVYVLFLPAWLATWTGGGYANERFGIATWIGGSMIIAANLILQVGRPPHRASIAPAP